MRSCLALRWPVLAVLIATLCLLAAPVRAGPAEPARAAPASRVLFPFVAAYRPLSARLGYGVHRGLDGYVGVESLGAGWYLNWGVSARPPRPGGMEYVQTVSIHQKLACPLFSADAHDREKCPYAEPYDYVLATGRDAIAAAAAANPGSLWLIGNEMDRRDWPGGGQDEILPETYAVAYHDLHETIKRLDPTARIAIGGVIQPTPLRLEYLTRAWDAYRARYGAAMPVDVWNVHNFILREVLDEYGAGIPPGSTAHEGVTYPPFPGGDRSHVDMAIFDSQIRAFRAWMRDRGQQDKPLIVSEYGVLYSHAPGTASAGDVQRFMIATFDYFLDARDCTLGMPADGCRLVQRWAWFSLNDMGLEDGFNPYGALFDPRTKQITGTGALFRDYSLANLGRLQ